jgi:signal transduction histidine kinase
VQTNARFFAIKPAGGFNSGARVAIFRSRLLLNLSLASVFALTLSLISIVANNAVACAGNAAIESAAGRAIGALQESLHFCGDLLLTRFGLNQGSRFVERIITLAVFEIAPPIWQNRRPILIVALLVCWAIAAFERYRALKLKELNAALVESEELTKQLTTQQAELGRANRTLALDYAVTRALVESPTPVDAALRILQTICICAGWDVGAIWDVDPRSSAARCVGVWQKPMTDASRFEPLCRGQISLPGAGLPGRVFATRQPCWVANIEKCGSHPRAAFAAKASLCSGFGFPILVGREEVVGILEFYSREARQPEQELIQMMATIGGHIGQLIQRKRAEEDLIRSKEERLLELQRVRRRIATDLHDDVGSSLTKIALLSEASRQKAAEMNMDVSERLTTVTAISNELVETMSDIVWAINPQKDNLSDLSQRMRRFASDIFTARQIGFRFRAPLAEQDMRLGANMRREVFLIFKESVNNVVKHSESSEVILELDVKESWLCLTISDNGKGFDPALVKADTGYLTSERRGGNGLASMRRRARELGGQLEITTSKGRGATILLRLPIEHGLAGN